MSVGIADIVTKYTKADSVLLLRLVRACSIDEQFLSDLVTAKFNVRFLIHIKAVIIVKSSRFRKRDRPGHQLTFAVSVDKLVCKGVHDLRKITAYT